MTVVKRNTDAALTTSLQLKVYILLVVQVNNYAYISETEIQGSANSKDGIFALLKKLSPRFF